MPTAPSDGDSEEQKVPLPSLYNELPFYFHQEKKEPKSWEPLLALIKASMGPKDQDKTHSSLFQNKNLVPIMETHKVSEVHSHQRRS